MLHAAAMLAIFFALWIAGVLPSAVSRESAIVGVLSALLCVAWAARFGGVGRAFAHAPAMLMQAPRAMAAALASALTVTRAALGAGAIKPGLYRIRAARGAQEQALLAEAVGAAPGRLVVETDDSGMLVHVLDERRVDDAALDALVAKAPGGQRS